MVKVLSSDCDNKLTWLYTWSQFHCNMTVSWFCSYGNVSYFCAARGMPGQGPGWRRPWLLPGDTPQEVPLRSSLADTDCICHCRYANAWFLGWDCRGQKFSPCHAPDLQISAVGTSSGLSGLSGPQREFVLWWLATALGRAGEDLQTSPKPAVQREGGDSWCRTQPGGKGTPKQNICQGAACCLLPDVLGMDWAQTQAWAVRQSFHRPQLYYGLAFRVGLTSTHRGQGELFNRQRVRPHALKVCWEAPEFMGLLSWQI